jgi:hypothetical protein
MAKIKITKPERGDTPEGGWYFTSYRMPVALAQKLDRIAQKETKEQGVNISFSTATIRLLEHSIKEYGPTPGFKSEIEATVLKKASGGAKKAAKAAPAKAAPAKAVKKAEKKVEKKAAKKAAKAEKGKINIKLSKPVKKVKVEEAEEEVEVETAASAAAAEETEEEVELSD